MRDRLPAPAACFAKPKGRIRKQEMNANLEKKPVVKILGNAVSIEADDMMHGSVSHCDSVMFCD